MHTPAENQERHKIMHCKGVLGLVWVKRRAGIRHQQSTELGIRLRPFASLLLASCLHGVHSSHPPQARPVVDPDDAALLAAAAVDDDGERIAALRPRHSLALYAASSLSPAPPAYSPAPSPTSCKVGGISAASTKRRRTLVVFLRHFWCPLVPGLRRRSRARGLRRARVWLLQPLVPARLARARLFLFLCLFLSRPSTRDFRYFSSVLGPTGYPYTATSISMSTPPSTLPATNSAIDEDSQDGRAPPRPACTTHGSITLAYLESYGGLSVSDSFGVAYRKNLAEKREKKNMPNLKTGPHAHMGRLGVPLLHSEEFFARGTKISPIAHLLGDPYRNTTGISLFKAQARDTSSTILTRAELEFIGYGSTFKPGSKSTQLLDMDAPKYAERAFL
ncbi:hypothetical protein FB451DRAFT_1440105 [Mycena latifolia]|nr:hypothetical protein FB451DRAFT_1440105 [Mycena latifolia]